AAQLQPDLAQAEQVEMIDQEGAVQHQRPAEGEAAIHQYLADGALQRPDLTAQRLPETEQRDQRQAGEQHIGTALGRGRNDAGPHGLEGRPRHDAVLHSEQGQQQQVDGQRLDGGQQRFSVDAAGNVRQVADEGDGIEKGGEVHVVADDAVDEDGKEFHRNLPSSAGVTLALGQVDEEGTVGLEIAAQPTQDAAEN